MNGQTEFKKLGEICEVIGGGTPSTKVSVYWSGQHYWVTPKDLGQLKSAEISETEKKITNSGLKNSSAKLLPVGSVILSSRAPIGYVAINSVPMATNQGCRSFVCGPELFNKYLYYFLLGSRDHLQMLGSGSTFLEVSGSRLKEIEIPVPPMAEQRRIVEKIEKQFAKIDDAARLRAESLAATDQLLPATLHEIFSEGKQEGWKQATFTDMCTLQRGYDLPKHSRRAGAYPLVSSSGFIDSHDESKVKGPGVTVGRSGSVGSLTYVEKDYWPLNTVLYVKDFHGNDPRFVYYFLQNFGLKKYGTGSGVPTLNRNNLHSEPVLIPPLAEQKEIVKKLDALSEKVRALREIQLAQQSDLAALKQSILHEAYRCS